MTRVNAKNNSRYILFAVITLILSIIWGILHYIQRRLLLSGTALGIIYLPSNYVMLALACGLEKLICTKLRFNNKFLALMFFISYMVPHMLINYLMPI